MRSDRAINAHLAETIGLRLTEFGEIPCDRRGQLADLARWINTVCGGTDDVARLNFICTHNSRRSHLAQLWAQVGAAHFEVDRVRTYSGGTEATAFNSRAVAALRRAGFDIEAITAGDENPVYLARLGADHPAMVCFSKGYSHPPNPRAGYAAVMVCDSADDACPIVHGCAARFAIRYIDPKVGDDTPGEGGVYDERSDQIAREMLYVMSLVAGGGGEVVRG